MLNHGLFKIFILTLLVCIIPVTPSHSDEQAVENCPSVANKLGLILTIDKKNSNHCQIKQVIPFSRAWRLHLSTGDIITAVNQRPLNPDDPCLDFTTQLLQLTGRYLSNDLPLSPKSTYFWLKRGIEGGVGLIKNPLQTQQIKLQEKLDPKSINPLFQNMACLATHSPYPVLPIVKAVQNNPLKLYSAIESIQQRLNPAKTTERNIILSDLLNKIQTLSYPHLPHSTLINHEFATTASLQQKIHWPTAPIEPIASIPLNCSSKTVFNQLEIFLSKSHHLTRVAFIDISQQQTQFFMTHYQQLSNSITQSKSIIDETDQSKLDTIHQLLDIAARVNMPKLSLAAAHWFQLADPDWLSGLQHCLSTLDHTVPLQQHTPYGKIILGTQQDDIYHIQEKIALLIDPAGNDIYQQSTEDLVKLKSSMPLASPFFVKGGLRGFKTPQHLFNTAIIDLAGHDQYDTTQASGFAFAALGNSLLIDLSGNDQYRAGHWAQGSAFAGIAALYDFQGNDQYSADSFSQAAALSGTALLIDKQGNDQYKMQHHGQALGLPYGHAVLMDNQGNDQYIMNNGLTSSYQHSPTSTESWGQGCGKGFRHILPGGLGILLDTQGHDSFSAGEFAQGGGYYYAMGLLYNSGHEDDNYQGSRYNNGFAAHQAIGGLIESGGDDHYQSTGPAFCGTAWDQSISLFYDQAGDDNYSGRDFSYAAGAHNSIASFLDISGQDKFNGTINPAHITGNQYHGGQSLSYFFSASQSIPQRIDLNKHEFVIILPADPRQKSER